MIDLQIHRRSGEIGLKINNASYDLQINKPDLNIKQVPADIVLERTAPEIQIDYSPRQEALGYGGIEVMSRRFVGEAIHNYMSNLERSVHIGYSLGAIEKKLSIGEVVARSVEPKERDVGIVPVPSINITAQPGTLRYRAEIGNVSTDLRQGNIAVNNFIFPSVEVYLEQEPELRIKAVGQNIDQKK